VLSGYTNEACALDSAIGSGYLNVISAAGDSSAAEFSFIGSGSSNVIAGQSAFIGAGQNNGVSGDGGFVGAGNSGQAVGGSSFVGAGDGDRASGLAAFAGAGNQNVAGGGYSFVGSGTYNSATGDGSFIGAGDYQYIVNCYTNKKCSGNGNTVSGTDSFIGAGDQNTVSASEAFDGGGSANTIAAQADWGTVGGGKYNDVAGIYATIPGGASNTAAGELSFAAGYHADATQTGSFVWSDYVAGSSVVKDSAADQFVVRASGGTYIYSSENVKSGVMLSAGSGTWASLSDRTAKTDIAPLNDAAILSKVATLPVSTWRYKTEAGVRHVGPMAQDFYAAFGVGEDDRHITSIDEDGVALAAIKALHRENGNLHAENRDLRSRLARLERTVNELVERDSPALAQGKGR
jgi:hypothetical protein